MSNLRCPVTDQKDEILKSFQDITQTVSFDNTAIVWFVKKKKNGGDYRFKKETLCLISDVQSFNVGKIKSNTNQNRMDYLI